MARPSIHESRLRSNGIACEYICRMICLVLLVRCMLPELTAVPRHRKVFVPSLAFGAFEKTALSAASHKDHDGEVEHDEIGRASCRERVC